jgi:hypothetical protein
LNLSANKATAAEQVLRVSPIIINLPLSPGKTYEHEVTVENLTDNALPLRASLSDFQTTGEEGGYIFGESHTNPLLSWIKLSENALILNPKEKKTILATITTPTSIPLGGYYGMLFFEVVPQSDIAATRVIPKIGVLILANVGVPDPNAPQADILAYSIGLIHETKEIPLLLRVKNVSLHYFTAKPILTISPLLVFSKDKNDTHYLEEKIVFQGKVRRWEESLLLKDAKPNIYKAHLMLSTGNGKFVEQATYFVVFPFAKVIIAALVILLILFVYKKRKRFGKAFRELAR